MRSECSGAKAKTGVRTRPHVARGICVVRSVNVCIQKKNGMCTRVTRQSGNLCLEAIERLREELSYSRLRVCGSVIRLEDIRTHNLYGLQCETHTDPLSLM